jgi:hypothetical protein
VAQASPQAVSCGCQPRTRSDTAFRCPGPTGRDALTHAVKQVNSGWGSGAPHCVAIEPVGVGHKIAEWRRPGRITLGAGQRARPALDGDVEIRLGQERGTKAAVKQAADERPRGRILTLHYDIPYVSLAVRYGLTLSYSAIVRCPSTVVRSQAISGCTGRRPSFINSQRTNRTACSPDIFHQSGPLGLPSSK